MFPGFSLYKSCKNNYECTHSALPFFDECGIKSIQNKVIFRTAAFVYKSLNGLTPIYMSSNMIFQKIANVFTRNTRCSVIPISLYDPNKDMSKRVLGVRTRVTRLGPYSWFVPMIDG